MPKCPNCGQKTSRTGDWACPWCGYPLLSESYKKIPKTYQQLKEEELTEQKSPVKEEPAPVSELELAPELEPEAAVELEPEPAPELEPAPEPEPEPVLESRVKLVRKLRARPAPKARPEPVPAPKVKPAREPRAKAAPKAKPEPVLEVEPVPTAMEMTVEELLSTYAAEGVAAEVKFSNKILRVTGVVGRIEAKEILDIYYVNLTNAERNLSQNLRCIFDRTHRAELSQLMTGQTVTIQGEYDGSIMDIRMSNCALIH